MTTTTTYHSEDMSSKCILVVIRKASATRSGRKEPDRINRARGLVTPPELEQAAFPIRELPALQLPQLMP